MENEELTGQPVRSRWTPKPEQILILESIFNGGMENPPNDETVRIRKLLEKFGSVGDANVFYWFQNRRSRSRRHQRQIQADLGTVGEPPQHQGPRQGEHAVGFAGVNLASSSVVGPGARRQQRQIQADLGAVGEPRQHQGSRQCEHAVGFAGVNLANSGIVGSGSSSSFGLDGGLFSFSGHPHPDSDTHNLHYHSPGLITVFINGIATEVGRGALNLKAMFGGDYGLVDSSGQPIEVNDLGFVVQTLHHGQTYFLENEEWR